MNEGYALVETTPPPKHNENENPSSSLLLLVFKASRHVWCACATVHDAFPEINCQKMTSSHLVVLVFSELFQKKSLQKETNKNPSFGD